jgi:hypothetical protein
MLSYREITELRISYWLSLYSLDVVLRLGNKRSKLGDNEKNDYDFDD